MLPDATREQDVADDLDRFLHAEPINARPIGPSTRAARWCHRNPIIAGLAAAVVGTLLIGFLSSTYLALRLKQSNDTIKHTLATELIAKSGLLRETRPEGYGQEVREILHRSFSSGRISPIQG